MKTTIFSFATASAAAVDDASTLLSIATQSSTASTLMNAVGHRNVTAMEALVQELAEESISGVGQFDPDIQSALKAIRWTFVGSIQKALKDQHKADQEHFNCFTKDCFEGCTSDYGKTLQACDDKEATCDKAAREHNQCRQSNAKGTGLFDLYKDMGKKCAALHCLDWDVGKCHEEKCLCTDLSNCHHSTTELDLDDWRASIKKKDELPEDWNIDKKKDYLQHKDACQASTIANFAEDAKQTWHTEDCKAGHGNWLQGQLIRYREAYKDWLNKYNACKTAYHLFLKQDQECDALQKKFEGCVCEKNKCESDACHTDLDQCQARCWDRYESLVKEKQCLEKDRKIDWSATKKIECYIDVLLHQYTEDELLDKCGTGCDISKAREEDYKQCATICPNVDYEGYWPEAHGHWPEVRFPAVVTGHKPRQNVTEFQQGDSTYACDSNGDMVFTKHRSPHRDDEDRCTEHLDIDYQTPDCVACRGPPEEVCAPSFLHRYYSKYDDVERIGCLSGECCNDNGKQGCFKAVPLTSSSDGLEVTSLTLWEHSHAWAYNRCPCTSCSDAAPEYTPRPPGRQCGMGAHTISPSEKKTPTFHLNVCVKKDEDFTAIDLSKIPFERRCTQRITLTRAENNPGDFGTGDQNLNLVLRDEFGRYVAPVFDNTVGMTPQYTVGHHDYKIDGVSKGSEKMAITFIEPVIFDQTAYRFGFDQGRADGCWDVAVEGTTGCQELTPLQYNNVCVSASGDKFGTLKDLPADTCISGITVHWINGYLSCRRPETGVSRFGCDDESIGLVFTALDSKDVLMPHWDDGHPGAVEGVIDGGASHAQWYRMTRARTARTSWYKMDQGNMANARSLALQLKQTMKVTSGGLNLWYNEDLTGGTEGDNHGRACFDVSVHRAREC